MLLREIKFRRSKFTKFEKGFCITADEPLSADILIDKDGKIVKKPYFYEWGLMVLDLGKLLE